MFSLVQQNWEDKEKQNTPLKPCLFGDRNEVKPQTVSQTGRTLCSWKKNLLGIFYLLSGESHYGGIQLYPQHS